MKKADCSIAMADGSEVARNLSNIVLLDSKFSSLPAVVKEGRQVINNVQQSSTLFLMKTVFTLLLSLVAIITRSPYPFSPSQLLLTEMFVIGLPSVILAIQPNDKLITGDFSSKVLKRALPNGLLMLFNAIVVIALNNFGFLSAGEFSTLSTLVLIGTGFVNLCYLCVPFNIIRTICVCLSGGLILIASLALGNFFGITECTFKVFMIFVILVGLAVPTHIFIPKLSDFLYDKIKKMDDNFKKKLAENKEKKLKKQRLKKFKTKAKKKLYKGEIILKDLDDEE